MSTQDHLGLDKKAEEESKNEKEDTGVGGMIGRVYIPDLLEPNLSFLSLFSPAVSTEWILTNLPRSCRPQCLQSR